MSAAADPLHDLAAPGPGEAMPPAVLLPYQQAWIADDAALKICEKGRRVGLTWAEAADDVTIAAREDRPENVMYISATEDMGREYIEACAMWARAFDFAAGQIGTGLYDDGGVRSIKTFELQLPATGCRIVALSSRPTNLRGKQGTVVIDEAAFHQDLPGMLKAALALLLWGSRVRIISTHDGAENAFAQLVDEVRAGRRGGATVHRVTFGDAVAQGLYRRVCLRRGIEWTQAGEDEWVRAAYRYYGDDAAEELDVVPSASGGRYLSLALISQRMVPAWGPDNPDGPALVRGRWDDGFAYLDEAVRRYAIDGWLAEHVLPHLRRLDGDRRHVFGQDFARSADLSVITVLAEDGDLSHRVRLVLELANCPFSSQQQILFAVIAALPRFRGGAMDATGNGAALAEAAAQRWGVEMVEQVKINAGWYLAHMPKLRAGLQDGTLHGIPRDDALRDDLRAIALVQGVPMVPRQNTASAAARAMAAEGGSKSARRHGDFAVALLMAEYAWHREAGEIAWTPAPDRRADWEGADDDGLGAWAWQRADGQIGRKAGL